MRNAHAAPVVNLSVSLREAPDQPAKPRNALSLGLRLTFFVVLFAAEWIPITSVIHKRRTGSALLLQMAVVFACIFLAIAYPKARAIFQRMSTELATAGIGWGFLAGHAAALIGFIGLSQATAGPASGMQSAILALWYTSGILATVLAWCAFVPPALSLALVRGTGYAWLYAAGAGFISTRLVTYSQLWNGAVWNPSVNLSWKPAVDATFVLVKTFLHLFLPVVVADRTTMTIGSPRFSVQILPWCAGFEGIALMLVFSTAWLWFFRRELRFPHALVLLPVGMAVIWLFNAVRITALILIGVAGAPDVAIGGFHSQAGWIAFNCVALGVAIVSRRVTWFRKSSFHPTAEATGPNPTAAYLTPFLTLLAAGMISRATSGAFEWLYPLRFIAVLVALWFFRSKYRELDWRFGWISVAAGIATFGIWLGLDALAGPHADTGIASGLASLAGPWRMAWLGIRIAGATLTVPIAEELAFRGFLIRRLISADFEALSPRRYTFVAILISSVAFGLMHGDRWLAGTLAGLIFAAAYLRQGRIGDAVVAHATTNALLAAWVLTTGQWYLW